MGAFTLNTMFKMRFSYRIWYFFPAFASIQTIQYHISWLKSGPYVIKAKVINKIWQRVRFGRECKKCGARVNTGPQNKFRSLTIVRHCKHVSRHAYVGQRVRCIQVWYIWEKKGCSRYELTKDQMCNFRVCVPESPVLKRMFTKTVHSKYD